MVFGGQYYWEQYIGPLLAKIPIVLSIICTQLACGDHLGSILEVTLEARLTNDPEIEVRTKLVGYLGQALLSWHWGLIGIHIHLTKQEDSEVTHGGQAHK